MNADVASPSTYAPAFGSLLNGLFSPKFVTSPPSAFVGSKNLRTAFVAGARTVAGRLKSELIRSLLPAPDLAKSNRLFLIDPR